MYNEILQKKVWAVVGANDKKDKFGYKVYKKLKECGYTVYPINPGLSEIFGDVCYKSLADLPEKVDVVNFVVPEAIGISTLEKMKELDLKTAWLQPGADKVAVVEKAHELGIEAITACVLVALRDR